MITVDDEQCKLGRKRTAWMASTVELKILPQVAEHVGHAFLVVLIQEATVRRTGLLYFKVVCTNTLLEASFKAVVSNQNGLKLHVDSFSLNFQRFYLF